MLTMPFVPGEVHVAIRAAKEAGDGEGIASNIWRASGRRIEAEPEKWNYNFWAGSWDVSMEDV